MADPLDLDTILAEFSEDDPALHEEAEYTCSRGASLRGRNIKAIEVKLKQAVRGVAGSGNPADGFVVHSPNEVFENFWDD